MGRLPDNRIEKFFTEGPYRAPVTLSGTAAAIESGGDGALCESPMSERRWNLADFETVLAAPTVSVDELRRWLPHRRAAEIRWLRAAIHAWHTPPVSVQTRLETGACGTGGEAVYRGL